MTEQPDEVAFPCSDEKQLESFKDFALQDRYRDCRLVKPSYEISSGPWRPLVDDFRNWAVQAA